MSALKRSTQVPYKRWKDTNISFVTSQTDDKSIITVHEEQPGKNEPSNEGVCTILEQDLGDSKNRSSRTSGTFTVEEAVEAIGFGKFQWKLSMLTGVAWMADAMEMMLLSIATPQLRCEWRLSSWKVAFITTMVFIGMMISSSLWGNISDKYGRKVCLILCMLWSLHYGFLSAFAPTYSWILILRGLVGFGLGGAPQSVTLYTEFLPVKSRGKSVILLGVFWGLGAVFEVLLAMVVMPTLGWKWLLAFSTLPLVVFAASCCWLPESARFDVLRGREDKALDTLKCIAAANGSSVPTGRLIANTQTDRGRIRDLFIPEYRKTTLLVWFIWFCNAFSYYGLVLLTTELFQAGSACSATDKSNMEPLCSLECSYLTFHDYVDLLWTTFAEFPGILVTVWMIDRIGRRKSMAVCFLLFSVSILPLYACTQRTLLIVFIFIARACITGGWQVAYVYTPEVFPTATRAIGIGTGSGMARVGALITPFFAQVLLKSSVYLTLSVYLICCLLGSVASWFLPMETTGRSLQESTQSTMEQKNIERPNGSETTESSSNTCP
ncbi:synaptic vesicle 2-related protein-like isoform X1 [Carassius carassius]|uniref:synaptic vesicle 2-related protein-like isoform X1 n=2 Tax=Carassius carassius TaxID=217509 RepID=UPI00286883C5|nr:synaptic vesicle 2-related protein-like isoform X1 [Carassius carassius]XP_059406637.1 synaptic vesicle 2-related protein-like isoform X1 [Carassius carassius]